MAAIQAGCCGRALVVAVNAPPCLADSGRLPVSRRLRGSTNLTEPTAVQVIDEPTDGDVAKVRPGADPLHIGAERGELVLGGEEGDAAGVRAAGRSDRRVDVVFRTV